jgi:hypothetical protein
VHVLSRWCCSTRGEGRVQVRSTAAYRFCLGDARCVREHAAGSSGTSRTAADGGSRAAPGSADRRSERAAAPRRQTSSRQALREASRRAPPCRAPQARPSRPSPCRASQEAGSRGAGTDADDSRAGAGADDSRADAGSAAQRALSRRIRNGRCRRSARFASGEVAQILRREVAIDEAPIRLGQSPGHRTGQRRRKRAAVDAAHRADA